MQSSKSALRLLVLGPSIAEDAAGKQSFTKSVKRHINRCRLWLMGASKGQAALLLLGLGGLTLLSLVVLLQVALRIERGAEQVGAAMEWRHYSGFYLHVCACRRASGAPGVCRQGVPVGPNLGTPRLGVRARARP